MQTPAGRRKVLVTGGAGFVGSHLCLRLLRTGHEVICLDNLQTGSMENIAPCRDFDSFRFLQHDVTEPFDVQGVTDILSLACPAAPPHYQRDPVRTIKTSVLGTLHALELAHRENARMLQTSTSEVYGDPAVHPQIETYWGNVNPIGIRACYDEGKRCAETLCFDFQRMHGTDVKVVRLFNTYGPNMQPDDGRVVSNFIIQALTGKPLTIYGDGSQTRSFCYVDDTVEGILRMLDSDAHGPVNIGNPGEFTMLELAQAVLEITGSDSKLEWHPLPADDPKRRKPDITLAKQLLDWTPVTPLRDGLVKTVRYFKEKIFNG